MAQHPGRLELWEGSPRFLFDGAHNPAAARALREYLDEFVTAPITMIFSAMHDKSIDEMAQVLFPAADKLILTQMDNPRAASLEMMKSLVVEKINRPVREAMDVREALRLAKECTAANDLVCVTGSLYLVGEVQRAFHGPLARPLSRATA